MDSRLSRVVFESDEHGHYQLLPENIRLTDQAQMALIDLIERRFSELTRLDGTISHFRELDDFDLPTKWQVTVRRRKTGDRYPTLILTTASQAATFDGRSAVAGAETKSNGRQQESVTKSIDKSDWAAIYLSSCERQLIDKLPDVERRFAVQLALRRLEQMATDRPDEFLRLTLAGHLMVLSHVAEQSSDSVESGFLKVAMAVLNESLAAEEQSTASGTARSAPSSRWWQFLGLG